jgi:vancomycin resistance protein YoaR
MPEITDAELEQFNKYKELGEVDTVATSLTDYNTVVRDSVINEAAAIAGFKPAVLSKLSSDIVIEIKEGKAMVGEQELNTYAEENWEDFIPSLKSSTDTNKTSVPFVRQPAKPAREIDQTKQVVNSFLTRTYTATKAETN